MEFEEVSNFIKMGHVDGANLSTPSLQWRQPLIVEPLGGGTNRGDSSGNAGLRPIHLTNTKRPNPILGVSRLVNSVRRFKKANDIDTNWKVTVSPLGTSPTTTPPSTSRPSSPPPPQMLNLHEIKYQMETFIVPADWHNTNDPSSIDQVGRSSGVTGSRVIVNLNECIARFEYLLALEQQKIATCRTDMNDYVDKLGELDTKIQQLNTRLTLERLERTSHMNEVLRTANARIPRLQNLRDRQKQTVTKIEGYIKSSNLEKRLYVLGMQTRTTHIEATWARLRDWGPVVTIVSFILLFILVILQFGT